MRFRVGAAVLLALATATSVHAQSATAKPAPPPSHPCQGDPAYHKLDFWVGKWDV